MNLFKQRFKTGSQHGRLVFFDDEGDGVIAFAPLQVENAFSRYTYCADGEVGHGIEFDMPCHRHRFM